MPSSYVAPVTARPPNENLPFITVVNFVLRNFVLMLVLGVVFMLLMVIPFAFSPPTYTASASFITEGEQPAGRLILGGLTLPGTAGRGPEFFVELLRSPAILGPLVETRFEGEPGKPPKTLVERYAGTQGPPQALKEEAMAQMGSKIATKISLNGIITLRVTTEDPRLSANVTQGLLDQIDEFNNNKRKSQASAERKFAEQRLAEVGAEVLVLEDRYQRFLERNRVINSPALTIERDRISDELSMKRSLKSSIVQAYERAKMDEVRDSPRATMLASPTPPTAPNRQVSKRYAVLGFFFGAMLAAFIAVTKEYFARIPKESSPEASEFAALVSTQRLRRPIDAVRSAFRRPSSLS